VAKLKDGGDGVQQIHMFIWSRLLRRVAGRRLIEVFWVGDLLQGRL
jgi:hypothetical protein